MSKKIEDSAVAKRFVRYAKIHTTSDDDSTTYPSTPCQFVLAKMLEQELKEMGAQDVKTSPYSYVYAKIPATPGYEDKPALGFIAHIDTSPDFSGENVNPVAHEDYDGGDLDIGNGVVLTVKEFPHLARLKGRTLITADGTTLLGVDDKAGVAEIMTLADILIHENIPHGKICIGFTPDEEVGKGPDKFELDTFGADFAYTLDGELEDNIEYECFNAASAEIDITGKSVHPGTAKDVMVNASLLAMEFNSMIPAGQTPRDTCNREGFWHLTDMEGEVASAKLWYIIRDFDKDNFAVRKETLLKIAKAMNEKYGEGVVKVRIEDSYPNMVEVIRDNMHLVDNVYAAMRENDIEPDCHPIRGGTDGARLSFMGLPCPNIGTGGNAYHGPYEHVTVEGMEKAVEVLLTITGYYAK